MRLSTCVVTGAPARHRPARTCCRAITSSRSDPESIRRRRHSSADPHNLEFDLAFRHRPCQPRRHRPQRLRTQCLRASVPSCAGRPGPPGLTTLTCSSAITSHIRSTDEFDDIASGSVMSVASPRSTAWHSASASFLAVLLGVWRFHCPAARASAVAAAGPLIVGVYTVPCVAPDRSYGPCRRREPDDPPDPGLVLFLAARRERRTGFASLLSSPEAARRPPRRRHGR